MRKILFIIPFFLWTCGGGGSSPTEPTIEPPVVQNFTLSTFVNTPVEVSLSGVESEGLPLSFSITTQPMNGMIELEGANGTYTPNLNFIGTDSFAYIATSTNGQSNIGLVQVTVSRDENNFEFTFSIEGRGFDARDLTELSREFCYWYCTNSGGFINQQTYLIGLNNYFEEIWRKYTGPIGNSTYMKKIKSTGDGGFIVFGSHENSFHLQKFTSSGDLEWSQTYSSSDYFNAEDVCVLDDGNIVMVGQTNINGYTQTLLTIVDSNGNLQSENTYGDNGYDSHGDSYKTTMEDFSCRTKKEAKFVDGMENLK